VNQAGIQLNKALNSGFPTATMRYIAAPLCTLANVARDYF
jgi:hypothetical protein